MVKEEHTSRWSTAAFAVAFAITLAFFMMVIWPFVIPVLIGAFIVVLLDGPHEALVRRLKGRRGIASLLSSLGVFILVLLPFVGIVYLLVEQTIALIAEARAYLGPGGIEELLGGRVPPILEPLVEWIQTLGIGQQLQGLLNSLGTFLTGLLGAALSATTRLLINGFLVIASMYYFFLDGRRLLEEASSMSPLPRGYELEFFEEFRGVAQTMIFVNLVTALVQGMLGGIGFMIVSLPSPLVWAVLMGMLSLAPVVGTGLVWAPAGIFLLISGQTLAGIFLLAWGVVVVGTVDNVLRPVLAKGRIRLHPLLVFVTIFGGIIAFGAIGVVIGPLIGSLFTAMVRIWRRDFAPRLLGTRPAAEPPKSNP